MRHVLLGLGGNVAAGWGPPAKTLARALRALSHAGLVVERVSPLYRTKAVGGAGPDYRNAVARVATSLPPLGVLRVLKQIERQAGRRPGRRWGPRPLDIDVLDDPGRTLGWRRPVRGPRQGATRGTGVLIVPHPELHRRAFVLIPLLDVVPAWRHPVLRQSGRALLAGLPKAHRDVRPALECWPAP